MTSAITSEAVVAICDLHVRRGRHDVLPGLSLEVPRRTVTGLLGPSGCGKSTLMRAIVGVQEVQGGQVTVLGEPAGSAGLRRRVGYVTQAPSVYADLTTRENLEYFARVLGVPPARAEVVLATVDLQQQADQVAGDLSGGERSRLRRRRLPGHRRAGGGGMTGAIALATARRVALQLVRDRRTTAMVLLVPPLLLVLLNWIFGDQPGTFDRIGVPLIGLFPLIMMFLITSIAMLRERTSGTLERLMTMPLSKLDLIAGYALAFAAVATLQATLTSAVAFGPLGIDAAGPAWAVVLLAIGNALLGTSLGLLLSAFARTEFQAVQFLPVFLLPQILLAGLLIPRDKMPAGAEALSNLLPFTYAYDALAKVAANDIDARLWLDVVVVNACIILALMLGAGTLRRRTP